MGGARLAKQQARRARGLHAVCLGFFSDIAAGWGDWGAMSNFAVALLCYLVVGFGLLVRAQDPQSFDAFGADVHEHHGGQIRGYLWCGAGVFGLWLLQCLRVVWADNTRGLTSSYCVVYDIMTEGKIVTHAVLLALAGLSLVHYFFATLLLLDIVNFNENLANVVKAATRPYRALLWTLFLFLVVILIYAAFGMYFFGDDFRGADDYDDVRTCTNLLQCFAQIASQGIRTPEELAMRGLLNSEDGYLTRMAFDVTFFIIVGALLFNMVTGIIVDTFGELREASKEHAEYLANNCFVCGVSREQLEEPGVGGVIFDFDRHNDEEHNLWAYVYFINYLSRKDPLDYNGVESDVHAKIVAHDTSWFPIKRWVRQQEVERRLQMGGELTEEQRELRALRQNVERLAKLVEDSSAAAKHDREARSKPNEAK